jgi:hypothetical protein
VFGDVTGDEFGRGGIRTDTPHESDLPDSISNLSLPRETDPPAGDERDEDTPSNVELTGVGADGEATHSRGVIDRLRRWFS